MKKNIVLAAATLLLATGAQARSLLVTQGDVTYSFPSSITEAMPFAKGKTLSVAGKTFTISELSSISVSEEDMAERTVEISYSGEKATVMVSGDAAQYLDIEVDGAYVTVTQSELISDNVCGEITYNLAGRSDSGSFTLKAAYKASLELHGLELSSQRGAAIDIQSGKRTAIRVAEGTVNTLRDAEDGKQKACIYCKGHLEFRQKGKLQVTSLAGHGIAAKEYIDIKNTDITVLGAQKDGINCAQYFLMQSGALVIENVADDGIQVDYKDSENREEEDTGSATITGGKMKITVSGDATQGIKTQGNFYMADGTLTITANGEGLWDTSKLKTKAASCIGSDCDVEISGGTLVLTATGGGGKGINTDNLFHLAGGSVSIYTSGGVLAYVNGKLNYNYTGNTDNLNSDYKSSPKGVKADGEVIIDGGEISVYTRGASGEGIESKGTLTINDGDVTIRAYEDGTNSSSHTYLKGGTLTVTTGTGDAVDSNGAIYVSGGYLRVIGAGGSEQGFDAGDGYQIYITGGTMLAAGGGNSAPSSSASTQAYLVLTQAVNPGETVSVLDGDTELCSFEVPAKYSSTEAAAPMRGPGGWGWGGSTGNSLLLSCPEMVNGQPYTVKAGTVTTTSTARVTGGSSGPGGGR